LELSGEPHVVPDLYRGQRHTATPRPWWSRLGHRRCCRTATPSAQKEREKASGDPLTSEAGNTVPRGILPSWLIRSAAKLELRLTDCCWKTVQTCRTRPATPGVVNCGEGSCFGLTRGCGGSGGCKGRKERERKGMALRLAAGWFHWSAGLVFMLFCWPLSPSHGSICADHHTQPPTPRPYVHAERDDSLSLS